MLSFYLNSDNQVVVTSNGGTGKVLPAPGYSVDEILLRRSLAGDNGDVTHFLISVLKIPKSRALTTITKALKQAWMTVPTVLLLCDLEELSKYIKGIGPYSVGILEAAILKYS